MLLRAAASVRLTTSSCTSDDDESISGFATLAELLFPVDETTTAVGLVGDEELPLLLQLLDEDDDASVSSFSRKSKGGTSCATSLISMSLPREGDIASEEEKDAGVVFVGGGVAAAADCDKGGAGEDADERRTPDWTASK